MSIAKIQPRKSLNKAFLKVKPIRKDIELFKTNLIDLLNKCNESEHEEFNKNLMSDFLKNTYYSPNYFINTKERNDLVIHNGKNAKTSVGVLIEAKTPSNKYEMLQKDNINTKAFHELILYYLRERILGKNLDVKHLIATNVYEWFIFDAQVFEKLFAQNKKLVKQFKDFEAKRLPSSNTDFFYKSIAEPFVAELKETIEFTYFNLKDYEKPLKNEDLKDDNKLIVLYKIFAPEHLLKLPFANDSNSLDKTFYSELLYIMGLAETKQGGKKIIERAKGKERNEGSIIENAINQLDYRDKLSQFEKPSQFGDTREERLYHVALDLAITWINRILFLKLLEAQLIKYHQNKKDYAFLNTKTIPDFDELDSLFFQVLARKNEDRRDSINQKFGHIPYLNSSLFEPTDTEQKGMFVTELKNNATIPYFDKTVLRNTQGKKLHGEVDTLTYLFQFLEAYDFSSEGSEEIQEENKSLINASVLGLIFEKINGYKDGSFFTPGFITMDMCRKTIRNAVIQKFKDQFGWNIEVFEDIKNYLADRRSSKDLKQFNELINSIRLCDPAVGSGHFLVSSLNELIVIKYELGILIDRNGQRISDYEIEIENDELIITDQSGNLFEYHVNEKSEALSKKSQTLQETLFHEKQTLIENCLFGVDINPNSVKICRLRLWIELLKNAYYNANNELETLPNLDINIKTGNSLISRFDLDTDLKKALKDSKWNLSTYRDAVATYRYAKSKEEKREMEQLINDIKNNFRSEINRNDPKLKKLYKKKGELDLLTTQSTLFERSKTDQKKWQKDVESFTKDIKKLESEVEEIKNNAIYENAFEWRFEFPEVLDDDGNFVGFDVVIGNPPYLDLKEIENDIVKYIFNNYTTSSNRVNLYSTFVEKGFLLLNKNGFFSFIIPNSILMGSSYQNLRNLISKEIYGIVKLPEKVFDDAVVETVIVEFKKEGNFDFCNTLAYKKDEKIVEIDNSLVYKVPKKSWEIYDNPKFNIYISDKILKPLSKIHNVGKRLGEIAGFTLGITPYDKYRGHSKDLIKNKEFHSEEKLSDDYKPLIKGKNIVPFYVDEKVDGYIKYGSWLGAPREERFFTEPRVIVRQIVSGNPPKIYAGYTDKPLYFTQIGFSIITKSDLSVFELTALLNSKLINFYHKYLFLDIEKELFQKILIENCKLFPCKAFADPIIIENLIRSIVKEKQQNPEADTSELENEIDRLVYVLYGLTEEEIEIVECSVK